MEQSLLIYFPLLVLQKISDVNYKGHVNKKKEKIDSGDTCHAELILDYLKFKGLEKIKAEEKIINVSDMPPLEGDDEEPTETVAEKKEIKSSKNRNRIKHFSSKRTINQTLNIISSSKRWGQIIQIKK